MKSLVSWMRIMLRVILYTGYHNGLFDLVKQTHPEINTDWIGSQLANISDEGKSIIRGDNDTIDKDITLVLSPAKYRRASTSTSHAKSYRSINLINQKLVQDIVARNTRIEVYVS